MNGDDKKSNLPMISFLAIMWGSSFILMKRALLVYSPYQIGALRILSAFIVMIPLVIPRLKSIERKKWKYFLASGMLGNGIPAMLFPLAETHINSAVAGMLNSLTPIFTLIVGVLIFGMTVSKTRVIGLFIGLIGAVLLLSGQREASSIFMINEFALFIVLATICYALSVNILRYKLADTDSLTNSAFALTCAGIPMGVYLFTTDFVPRTMYADGAAFAIFCILLLGLLSTAFSTILFNRLIKSSGALAASSITYLIPIVAVMWGFYDHEKFGWSSVAGLMAILAGVYIVNKKYKSERK